MARGLVDGARHVWHAPAGRARAGGDRRAPLLLRRLDHLGDPAVPELLQRPGRRRRRPGRAGGGRSRRRAPASSWRRWSRPRSPSGSASRPGSRSASRWPRRPRRCSSSSSASGCCYVGAFVLGVAAQGSKICVDTIVQTSVDDAFRGRVFSFYDVMFNIAFVSAAAFGAAGAARRRQLAARSSPWSPPATPLTAVVYARATSASPPAPSADGPSTTCRRAASPGA